MLGFQLSIDDDTSTICPRCGTVVPYGNAYCGKCGAPVSRVSYLAGDGPEPISTPRRTPPIQYPKYDRKFSVLERITKVIFSPKEAMEDIGLAPDYEGVIVVFVIWTIISAIGVALTIPKIQFVGPDSDLLNSVLATTLYGAIIFVPIVLVVRWLIKSYLIRHLTDSNAWDFNAAASVTGYAYIPNVIFAFIGMILSWILVPSITISTVDVETALAQMAQFAVDTFWVTTGLSAILTLVALFWKSKLGSLGTHAGTHETYSESSAFTVFMIVGFIGWLIDFFSSFI